MSHSKLPCAFPEPTAGDRRGTANFDCSPSVGCVTYKGKIYRYIGGPAMTSAQEAASQKCASSLGVTWLGAISSGPIGITILGVAVSLWGSGEENVDEASGRDALRPGRPPLSSRPPAR